MQSYRALMGSGHALAVSMTSDALYIPRANHNGI